MICFSRQSNKRSKDGVKMTTNGITIQVAKIMGIMGADFRVDTAER
jgi:hypothetical protein